MNKKFYLDREIIEALNDLDFNRTFCEAIERIFSQFSGAINVIDLAKQSSFVSLQVLKLGAETVMLVHSDCVNCELLQAIAETSNISGNRILFNENCGLEELGKKWVVLIADVVSNSGCLHQQVLEDISLAK